MVAIKGKNVYGGQNLAEFLRCSDYYTPSSPACLLKLDYKDRNSIILMLRSERKALCNLGSRTLSLFRRQKHFLAIESLSPSCLQFLFGKSWGQFESVGICIDKIRLFRANLSPVSYQVVLHWFQTRTT